MVDQITIFNFAGNPAQRSPQWRQSWCPGHHVLCHGNRREQTTLNNTWRDKKMKGEYIARQKMHLCLNSSLTVPVGGVGERQLTRLATPACLGRSFMFLSQMTTAATTTLRAVGHMARPNYDAWLAVPDGIRIRRVLYSYISWLLF